MDFEDFREIHCRHDALYVIIAIDMMSHELTRMITGKRNVASNIRNVVKRDIVVSRMNNLLSHLAVQHYTKESKTISKVFFVSDVITEVDIPTEICEKLKEYNVSNFTYKYGEYFDIDCIQDLLSNFEFHNVIHVNENKISHIEMNTTKHKVIKIGDLTRMTIESFIKSCNTLDNNKKTSLWSGPALCIIHGISAYLKNLIVPANLVVHQTTLNSEQIMNELRKLHNMQTINEMNQTLRLMENEATMFKVVFGIEIQKHISEQSLEKLFCTQKIYDKIKTNIPKDLINFEIKVINDDYAHTLKTMYQGAVGQLYFLPPCPCSSLDIDLDIETNQDE